jgi:hypothetical protein
LLLQFPFTPGQEWCRIIMSSNTTIIYL